MVVWSGVSPPGPSQRLLSSNRRSGLHHGHPPSRLVICTTAHCTRTASRAPQRSADSHPRYCCCCAGQKARLLLLPNNNPQQPKVHTPPVIPRLSLSGGGMASHAVLCSLLCTRASMRTKLSLCAVYRRRAIGAVAVAPRHFGDDRPLAPQYGARRLAATSQLLSLVHVLAH
jgi:hypothetical protein